MESPLRARTLRYHTISLSRIGARAPPRKTLVGTLTLGSLTEDGRRETNLGCSLPISFRKRSSGCYMCMIRMFSINTRRGINTKFDLSEKSLRIYNTFLFIKLD